MSCPIHTLRRHPSTCRLCPKEDGPGVPPLAAAEVARAKLLAMGAGQIDLFKVEPKPDRVSAVPPKRKRDWYRDWGRVERAGSKSR